MVVSMESAPERERDVGIVSPAKMAVGVDNLELVEGGVHDLVFGDHVLDHRDTEVANQASQSQRHQLVHVPSYRSGTTHTSLTEWCQQIQRSKARQWENFEKYFSSLSEKIKA